MPVTPIKIGTRPRTPRMIRSHVKFMMTPSIVWHSSRRSTFQEVSHPGHSANRVHVKSAMFGEQSIAERVLVLHKSRRSDGADEPHHVATRAGSLNEHGEGGTTLHVEVERTRFTRAHYWRSRGRNPPHQFNHVLQHVACRDICPRESSDGAVENVMRI